MLQSMKVYGKITGERYESLLDIFRRLAGNHRGNRTPAKETIDLLTLIS